MARDNMRLQVATSVSAVFAVRTGEPAGTTIVVGADVSGKIGAPRECSGAEGTKEWARVFAMSREMNLECGTEDGCK